MSFLSSMPFETESVSSIMGRYMDQAQALMSLTELVMRSDQCSLDEGQRELIAAYTSSINGCAYCYDTHRSTAEAFGIDADLLEALSEDIDAADIAENMKPLLHYAGKLTRTPSRMVQSDADNVFEAGWSENDFHFVVMVCALFNFFNRLIDGYGVKNDKDYRVSRGQFLAENGYQLKA